MNKLSTTSAIVMGAMLLSPIQVDSFSVSSRTFSAVNNLQRKQISSSSQLYQTPNGGINDQDNEIERLRSMAAKLRADAAALEADKAQALAEAAEKAFRQFDTNQDGEISVAELKDGLEKVLKTELSDKRVEELMKEFDASGDGAIQLDEFVGVDTFRNKLELLAQEEKRLAKEAKEKAKQEEVEAALALAKVDILNEKDPTPSDKVLSTLPYLLPLLDGLQWGRFLLSSEGAESNPFVLVLGLLYGLYRSIPFSGFIAYLALSFLGGNPSINRLVRFNMQQAIFIDIALFFPALIGGIAGVAGLNISTDVSQLGSDLIFVSLLATIGYSTISSLFGVAPNKLPIISQAVEDRMPNLDMFDVDTDGNVIFRPRKEDEDDNKKDTQ